MKRIYTVAIGLVVLLLMAASASAANVPKITSNGEQAYADWNTDTLSVYMDIYESSDGTYIDVSAYGTDADGKYYNFYGSTMITDDVLAVNSKKLNSASMSAVTFNVYDYTTYTEKPVTINVDWTGVGPITTIRYIMRSGPSYVVQKGSIREATATGSLIFDGSELLGGEKSSEGQIAQYTMVQRTV